MNKDPLISCAVYRDMGCSHVDGFLCDVDTCDILANYVEAGDPSTRYYCKTCGWIDNEHSHTNWFCRLIKYCERFQWGEK